MQKRLWIMLAVATATLVGYQNCGPGMVPLQIENSETGHGGTSEKLTCENSPVLGKWIADPTDPESEEMEFFDDCTGRSKVCSSNFTYSGFAANEGRAEVNVISMGANPNGCLPVGKTMCEYAVTDIGGSKRLEYSCGGLSLVLISASSIPTEVVPVEIPSPSPTPAPTSSPTPTPQPTPPSLAITVMGPKDVPIPLETLFISYAVKTDQLSSGEKASFTLLPASTAKCYLDQNGVSYSSRGGRVYGVQKAVCGPGKLSLRAELNGYAITDIEHVIYPTVDIDYQFKGLSSAASLGLPIDTSTGSWSHYINGPMDTRLFKSWSAEIASTQSATCNLSGTDMRKLTCSGSGSVTLLVRIVWLDGTTGSDSITLAPRK